VPYSSARATVTDVHIRSSVAGLRGLGRHGTKAIAVGPTWNAAGGWSRYASDRVVAPDPAFNRQEFVSALGNLARARGPFFAYPGREEAIDAITDASAAEPRLLAPFPTEALGALRKKSGLANLAASVGLRTPPMLRETTVAELSKARIAIPCAVKPADPVSRMRSTVVVESRDELDALLRRFCPQERILVQERVSGPVTSIGLVVSRGGRLCARFHHRVHRTWPVRAGQHALAVSVPPDEELVARSARLLVEAGYWGLAEVEFIYSQNGPVLIDVNPRFYGCLALPLACGVNLPAAWHAAALDEALFEPKPYRTGVVYRWFEADLMAALRGSPARLVRRPAGRAIGPMWASDDPLPAPLLMGTALATRLRSRWPTGDGGRKRGSWDAAERSTGRLSLRRGG